MSATEGPNVNPTDLLIDEFATAGDVDRDRAVDLLATLGEERIGELATMTADLAFRNLEAGHADPIAAAHRRAGRELGLAYRAAEQRKAVRA